MDKAKKFSMMIASLVETSPSASELGQPYKHGRLFCFAILGRGIMKRHVFTCCLLAFLATAAGPARAQIPVTDVASLTQQIQQVMSWVEQLKAMADQYQQMEQQYKSLTGNRGYGNIFNDPSLQQYLPADWQSVYGQLRAHGTDALSAGARAFREQIGDTRSCNLIADTNARMSCQQAISAPYQTYDVFQQALQVANQKPQQLQNLINAIQGTDDPKAIAELQARIAGEQAAMQNEMLKVQLSIQLAQVQNKLAQEQAERDRLNAVRKEGVEAYRQILGR